MISFKYRVLNPSFCKMSYVEIIGGRLEGNRPRNLLAREIRIHHEIPP